jgi:AraC family transcriptional regulator
MDVIAEADRILHDIRREITENPETARTTMLRLAALLSRSAPEPSRARGGLAPWQERKIEQYLRDRVQQQVRLDELAQHASLSVSHFCRAFKGTFGTTPHTYLVRLRLARAQELMLQTGSELGQIALACGFSDQSHLCRTFRRETGETPGRWRSRNCEMVQSRTSGHISVDPAQPCPDARA